MSDEAVRLAAGVAAAAAGGRVAAIGSGAFGLADAAWLWATTRTAEALIGLGVAAGIFIALSALRRLLAPATPPGGHARATLGGVGRRVASRTKDYFLALLSLELVSNYIGVPELLARAFDVLFTIAAVLQGAVWLRALALALIERRAARHDDAGQLASALGIVRLLITVAIWGVALILILDNLGVNVTGLVAGLGVGGIAIGLAAQGIFQDLFAALSIIFDRPFAKGDSINFGDTWGTVEAIGLKTTRIRSLTGEQIVVSNANLLGKELRNFARLERRRVTIKLGIVYQVPPDVADALPAMMTAIVAADAACAFVRAGLVGFGAGGPEFEVQFDVATQDYEVMHAARHRVLVEILRRFADDGIDFATSAGFVAAPSPPGHGAATSPPVRGAVAAVVRQP